MNPPLNLILGCFFSLSMFSKGIDKTLIYLKKDVQVTSSKYLKVKKLIEIGENKMWKEPHFAQQFFFEAQDVIESSTYFKKKEQEAKLNGLMAILFKRSDNFSLSLEHFNKSLLYYKSVKDTLSLSRTYHQIANLYRTNKKDEIAIDFYKKAIKSKKKLGNAIELASSYYKIGVSYSKLPTKQDSVLIYFNKAEKLFTQVNAQEKIYRVKHRKARFLIKQEKFNEAKKILLQNLEYYKNTNNKKCEASTEYIISYLYCKIGNFNLGLNHAEKALSIAIINKNDKIIVKILKLKVFFYLKKENFKEAFTNYKKYDLLKTKIYNETETKKYRTLKMHYTLREERKALELIANKQKSLKILYVILFIITLFGSLIIGFFVRKKFIKKVSTTSQKLEEEKITKEILKEQVKASEAEIKFLISNNKMKLLSKKELLEQLKQEELNTESKEVKQFLKDLIYKIKQQIIIEDKLQVIQSKIDEFDKGFDLKIRNLYPNLTKNEREVCTLLRLNLSIKEIVSIKNTTRDSIKSTRYRIRKKLGLNRGQELEKIIQDL